MIKNSIEVVKFYLKNPYFLRNLIINQGKNPEVLTDTQKYFIVWNAKRLGISVEESQERYFLSWRSIKFGHSGNTYRSFNSLCYNLFQVFYSDNVNEVYKAYEMHSYMHFLRMLSYTEPIWNDDNHIVKHLESYSSIDIIDYGCGIAQISRSLAIYMKNKGKYVRLYLIDIPTIRKGFLLWMGEQIDIEVKFLDCTIDSPMPKLPDCDVCVATEFFEHVFDPLKYLHEIDTSLRKNGLLITNVADHGKEFMHVSPNLKSLRKRISELKYDIIKENEIFNKS